MINKKINCKNRVALVTLFLLMFSVKANAQHRSDHWYFGDSAAIHFTDTGVVATTDGGLFSWEGCATMSDTLGNLLFYTNGWRIWNRNGDIMPNGDSIVHWTSEVEYENLVSVTQSAIILPYPEHEGQYVVFTNPTNHLIAQPYHPPVYCIVDMSLDGGLGDVIETSKSIPLLDSAATLEKMQAIRHANGRDWWILVMGYDIAGIPGWAAYGIDSSFLRFLLTPEGVKYVGDQHVGFTHNVIDLGEMVFSEQGDKLAIAGMVSLEVREFDRCTGMIGPRLFLDGVGYSAYGVAFSPDGSKLYVSGHISHQLYQYNLEMGEQDSVFRQLIFDGSDPFVMGQLQLGPDGKIYLAEGNNTIMSDTSFPNANTLSVINFPNLSGPACGFDAFSFDLKGRSCIFSLPNQPNYELGALTGSPCDTLGGTTGIYSPVREEHTILVFPQPASDKLTVIIPEIFEGEIQMEVFDYAGRLIRSQKNPADQNSIQFSVKDLAEGLYILSLRDEKGKKLSQTITIQ